MPPQLAGAGFLDDLGDHPDVPADVLGQELARGIRDLVADPADQPRREVLLSDVPLDRQLAGVVRAE